MTINIRKTDIPELDTAFPRVNLYPRVSEKNAWKAVLAARNKSSDHAAELFLEACAVLLKKDLSPRRENSWREIGADPKDVKEFWRTHKRRIRDAKKTIEFSSNKKGLSKHSPLNSFNSEYRRAQMALISGGKLRA